MRRTQDVVVVTPPATPVRRRSSGGVRRRRRRTYRRRGGGGSDGSFKNRLIGTAMGGLGYGLIEKHFGAQIPTVPLIGKSGTIAILSYFFGQKHPLIKDIGVAAAAIAGYSFGKEGKISGEYDD